MTQSLRELLSIPEESRHLGWIQVALQNAIELEWATVPPYLTAMWSIIDRDNDDVADSLKSIVMQEMLHMGLACNLLSTLGGIPRIADPQVVPKYPSELPGKVHVGLRIPLQRISKRLVATKFMRIEEPTETELRWHLGRSYKTIGAFYNAIDHALKRLPKDCFRGTRQRIVTHYMNLQPIATKPQALDAVRKIKQQGEGTAGSPMSEGSLAHYFRFGEMFHEHRYVEVSGGWDYVGDELEMPRVATGKVYPMAPVPFGGYPGVSDKFDLQYSQVLREMQRAWETKDDAIGQDSINKAIRMMKDDLPELAVSLMKRRIVNHKRKTFGPSFRFI